MTMDMDRRQSLGLIMGAGSIIGLPQIALAKPPASQMTKMEIDMLTPKLEFVYEAEGVLGAPVPIGETADGTRRIIPIFEGGKVSGPLINGALMGGGADWQLTRLDGVTVADATYAMKTDDGVVIQIHNKGLRRGPPEVMKRLAAGEAVDPAEYYFRTIPEFIAPKGKYEWMNQSVFICSGARYPAGIKLWVWRVL